MLHISSKSWVKQNDIAYDEAMFSCIGLCIHVFVIITIGLVWILHLFFKFASNFLSPFSVIPFQYNIRGNVVGAVQCGGVTCAGQCLVDSCSPQPTPLFRTLHHGRDDALCHSNLGYHIRRHTLGRTYERGEFVCVKLDCHNYLLIELICLHVVVLYPFEHS